MTAPLEFTDVTKDYAGFKALDGLSFKVQPGEVLGLLGHNGAGKTTSMKLVLGVIAPTQGDIRVLGESSTGHASDRLRRALGYLPENVSFYPQLTGREVLRYFARLKGAALHAVDELLERVGLSAAADRRIRTYSKGMRQRIGLAQALLGRPRLLLLDEPTAGLDPQVTREFYRMIDDLRGQGVSILISSHVLPGVEAHIDRAAILGRGRLLALGSLAELRDRARLPLRIRVQGEPDRDQAVELLRPLGFEPCPPGPVLELQGDPERKLEAVRALLALPGVTDFELIQPALEDLYAHFNRSGAAQPCTP
ncbi:nitrous oxide reductase maturation protein NosF [Thiohalobacter thiocyanaticus]|uniref:Nitrous oxide reductase maturation protein NosF n=1 Tax=Thiohalobacter thiocyanaticus TaxID=585455 RepID=A0A1Z4VMI6_9GAMM|nr:ABC transporter ATP-binding protein [Thiohalobacter thiocyanaticus]BAZ92831.1 nitrous oxide reductase maturation protein NosF [Thiohalobacter thiocyanaticus]